MAEATHAQPSILEDTTMGEVDLEVQRVLKDIAEGDNRKRQSYDTAVVLGSASGDSRESLAERFGICQDTVSNVLRHHRPALERLQNLFRARVLARALNAEKDITNGLISSAQDPENRNQPGAAKALGDLMGMNSRPTEVHIGDQFNQLHLDQSTHQTIMAELPPERAKRRRELEERFGLA